MRPLPIEVQARYLLATGDVDDIIVGNYPASTKELEALSKINFQALELRVDEVSEITDNENTSCMNLLHTGIDTIIHHLC
mgnify:CR=1 FL=1